jgi:hypothetical protein
VWWLTLIILAILEGQEDRGLRPAWTKGSQDPTSTSNWNDRHASPPCHPDPGQTGHTWETLFEKELKQKGLAMWLK